MYLSKALAFLIEFVASVYILLLMLRFLIAVTRADFTHPVSQFLWQITHTPLRGLRPYIPRWRGLELSVLLLMYGLQWLKLLLIQMLLTGSVHALGNAVLALADLLALAVSIFIVSISVQAVLSWFIADNGYHPNVVFLQRFNAPLLRQAQRHVPLLQGIDLSPMVVILALYLILMLLVQPLTDFGMRL